MALRVRQANTVTVVILVGDRKARWLRRELDRAMAVRERGSRGEETDEDDDGVPAL